MIQNYLKTGMVFYDSEDKQHFRQDCCKEVFVQYTDNEHFPSFQIYLTEDINFTVDCTWELYDLEDNLIGTFNVGDFNRDETYSKDDTYTYIHNFLLNSLGEDTNLDYPAGHDYETNYYLKVTFTLNDESTVSYYSEAFRICNVCKEGAVLNSVILLANGTNGLDVYKIHENGFLHVDNDDQGGEAYNTWTDGNFIYLANGSHGIEVYSISEYNILTHLDNDNQGGTAYGVWGDGSFIYLANGLNGIEVYSVDAAGILTHEDNDIIAATAYDVWGDGDYIYLANGANGIESYSVDGAGVLTHVDNNDRGGEARGVWGDGDFIYLANGTNGVEVYTTALGVFTHVNNDDQGGTAYDVWGDGDYLYLANGVRGIESYTVSGAGILTHVDDMVTDGKKVWGDGTYIYLACGNRGIESYSVDGAGVFTHVDHYVKGDTAYDVWGDGIFLYVANGNTGLQVFSVDGGVFTLLDTDDQGGTAYGVWGDGTYIYLANGSRGLEVYTVNAAGTLTHRDNDNQGGTAYGVYGDSGLIYLANGARGLETYTISGGLLTHRDNNDQGGTAYDVISVIPGGGGDIWLANGTNGVELYSANRSTGVLSHDNNYTPGAGEDARGVFYRNPYVFIAFNTDGIYSISGGIMVYADNNDQGGEAFGTWGDSNFIYLANGSRGIESYSVAGLGVLTHVDNDQQIDDAKGVFGDGTYVFLADGTNGIELYKNESGDFYYLDVDFIAGTGEGVFVDEILARDCDIGYIMLTWWSDCDWDDIIYQYGYRNFLYLNIELDTPSEDIVKNTTDRLGEQFVSDIIVKKIYRIKERIPEYLWNALIRLPVYGSEMPNFHCWITLPDGSACPMSELDVKGEWDTGNCMNTFEINFVDDDEYPVVAGNCCKNEDVSKVDEDVSLSI